MVREYEAGITEDEEDPNLLRLTITGRYKNTEIPPFSRARLFRRVDSIEEVRKYRSADDLRSDIETGIKWRLRERVGAFGIYGLATFNSIHIFTASDVPQSLLNVVYTSVLFMTGLYVWDNADDGVNKFNTALEAFKDTRFNVAGRLSEIVEQTPAQS